MNPTTLAFVLLSASCAAQAFDVRTGQSTPLVASPYATPQNGGTVIYNQARIVTDMDTGKQSIIVPMHAPTSNPGTGIYLDVESGRQFSTIEYNPGAR